MESGGFLLAEEAKKHGSAISDYLLCAKGPAGVFITAEHDEDQRAALNYFKVGEVPITHWSKFPPLSFRNYENNSRVIGGGGVLLNNTSTPSTVVEQLPNEVLHQGKKYHTVLEAFQSAGKR